MPSNLPSSFASAAAGQNANGRSGARTDGRGSASGEWLRQGRSTNGTQIFRRSSTTPQGSNQPMNPVSSMADAVQSPAGANVPDLDLAASVHSPQRHSRNQLLSLISTSDADEINLSALLMTGWDAGHVNGNVADHGHGTSSSLARGWSRNHDTQVLPQDPAVVWDATGSTALNSIHEMTAEERELFTDVNSNAKAPQQLNKDGANHSNGPVIGSKGPVSYAIGNGNVAIPSPSNSRRSTRRRETTEAGQLSGAGGTLSSPASGMRVFRDDAQGWMRRASTDANDLLLEEPEGELDDQEPSVPGHPGRMAGGQTCDNRVSSGSGYATVPSLWGAAAPGLPAPGISGIGSFGNFAVPGAGSVAVTASNSIGERRPVATRGESRLARLIPQDTADNPGSRINEPPSATAPSWRARTDPATESFDGVDNILTSVPSGSAQLGGALDDSPPYHQYVHRDPAGPLFETPARGSTSDFGMTGLNINTQTGRDYGQLSPSDTNPYRSPPGERAEHDDTGERSHARGDFGHNSTFVAQGRPIGHTGFDASDRSQTSSATAARQNTLSGLNGWPSSATPDRERAPFGFGNSLFGPAPENTLNSPGLAGFGNIFATTSSGSLAGTGRGGSRMGSILPVGMQAQMQGQQAHDTEGQDDALSDQRHGHPLGAIGRNTYVPSRDTGSPMRTGPRSVLDLFAPDANRMPGTGDQLHGNSAAPQRNAAITGVAVDHADGSSQPRQMVMPDRMRWVYLDPQGKEQGPFTGLEMSDWYKANFFTPDLRVKKLEDSEFEALGQLIRRIGNSREPFLVPQIGIPHGDPPESGPFSPTTAGAIQPPLVNAFPSFGRTLTAQEQNDLERRKQEEQYLMAQQRDAMASQQRLTRVQLQGHQGLQHHSSAQSLHSQPSFGSITSPIAMPPQPPIGHGPVGGTGSFFSIHQSHQANGQGTGQGLDMSREQAIPRATVSGSAADHELPSSQHGPASSGAQQPPIGSTAPHTGTVQTYLPRTDSLLTDSEGFRSRLQEFEELRAERDAVQSTPHHTPDEKSTEPSRSPSPRRSSLAERLAGRQAERQARADDNRRQFQQAQAAAAARVSGLPMPFPPPQSSTPLPAPAPQRVRSNLPAQYATATASDRSESPDTGTSAAASQPPTMAPWAKDRVSESQRGPSLKEIQEAEASKAAKREELDAERRRAHTEMEVTRERDNTATLGSGLPATSTWGTASPVGSAAGGSAWAKPTYARTPASGPTAPTAMDRKKTLAEIQREEEARKQKVQVSTSGVGAGKRYADLASKTKPVTAGNPTIAPGWSTVGAGGRVKIPSAPSAAARSGATSTSLVLTSPSGSNTVNKNSTKLAASNAGNSGTTVSTRQEAMREFEKWMKSQLSKGMEGMDISSVVQALMDYPPDAALIAELIYSNSKSMDGQHFSAEFLRRKKLADKGIIEKDIPSAPTAQSGGWNEVAKKGGNKETAASGAGGVPAGANGVPFKVVPRKRGGKGRK